MVSLLETVEVTSQDMAMDVYTLFITIVIFTRQVSTTRAPLLVFHVVEHTCCCIVINHATSSIMFVNVCVYVNE